MSEGESGSHSGAIRTFPSGGAVDNKECRIVRVTRTLMFRGKIRPQGPGPYIALVVGCALVLAALLSVATANFGVDSRSGGRSSSFTGGPVAGVSPNNRNVPLAVHGGGRVPAGAHPRPGMGGSYWSNISSSGAGAPAGTLGGAMAFDPGINATVFLGASGFDYAKYSASFEYSHYNWSSLPVSVPDEYAALGYDSSSSDLVAFGGEAPVTNELGNTISTNATYALEGGTWTNITSDLSSSPPTSGDPLMASDPAAGYALLLEPGVATNTSQTWAYSAGSWTNLTASAGLPPPGPGGSDSLLVYDPALGAPIFFGGSLPGPGYANATNETWEFRSGQWTNLHVAGPDFATGSIESMAYDGAASALVDLLAPAAYYSANGTPTYQQWDFTGGAWINATANLSILPPLGYDPLSVWDAVDGYLMYMSGGYDAQTWALGQIPLTALLSASPSPVDVGNESTIQVAATGGVPPLRYTYTGLPPGCPTSPASSFICVPTVAGNYTIHATVADGNNTTVDLSALLEVAPALVTAGPLVEFPSAYVGTSVNFSVSVSGGVPPYRFSWSVPATNCSTPDSARFNCVVDQIGSSLVSVSVTDSTPFAVTVDSATLAVVEPPNITSFAPSSEQIEVGSLLDFNVTVGGGALPISYSYAGLPPMCDSADTPTIGCEVTEAGAFNTTVTVTDALGTVRTATVTVTVVPLLQITVVTITPNPAPLGSTVSFTYSLSGGQSPFHSDWTDLPAGCAPAQSTFVCAMNISGSFDIGLTVRDGLDRVAVANVTLVVQPAASPVTAPGTGPVPLWAWGAAGAGAVILAGLLLWRRGVRPNDDTTEPAPASEGADEIDPPTRSYGP
jgi:hypothetical protein